MTKSFIIQCFSPDVVVTNNGNIDKDPTEWCFTGESIEVSDGYHTMHELYEHRMALNIALFNSWFMSRHNISLYFSLAQLQESGAELAPEVMKSKQHFDGDMFDGYFIVMAVTKYGQISYHYKLKHWDSFKIPEVDRTPKWDGHTSLKVMQRLMML